MDEVKRELLVTGMVVVDVAHLRTSASQEHRKNQSVELVRAILTNKFHLLNNLLVNAFA